MAGSGLSKYLKPRNYFWFFVERFLPANMLTNRQAASLDARRLTEISNVKVSTLNFTSAEYHDWVHRALPEWKDNFSDIDYKKMLEFFFSYKILEPAETDVFLDLAGGAYSYIPSLSVKEKIIHDQHTPEHLRALFGDDVRFLSSDAGDIELPSSSVDKISSHHAFEHFEGDSDIECIREIQRLLSKGGKCCLVPIFLTGKYVEATNTLDRGKQYDRRSIRVIDPTFRSSYTRFYDIQALEERVIGAIDHDQFDVSIVQLEIDGEPIPDMDLAVHARVMKANYPYRALVIERK